MVELLPRDAIPSNRMVEKSGFWWLNLPITMWCLFVDEVKGAGGKTLVHCHAGVSRSATICIAYVMYSRHASLDTAFEFVKSCRSEISPNAGFMHQLLEFEKEQEDKRRHLSPLSPLSPPCSPPCRFFSVSSSFCSSMDTGVSSPYSTPFSSPTALTSPMVAFTWRTSWRTGNDDTIPVEMRQTQKWRHCVVLRRSFAVGDKTFLWVQVTECLYKAHSWSLSSLQSLWQNSCDKGECKDMQSYRGITFDILLN